MPFESDVASDSPLSFRGRALSAALLTLVVLRVVYKFAFRAGLLRHGPRRSPA